MLAVNASKQVSWQEATMLDTWIGCWLSMWSPRFSRGLVLVAAAEDEAGLACRQAHTKLGKSMHGYLWLASYT